MVFTDVNISVDADGHDTQEGTKTGFYTHGTNGCAQDRAFFKPRLSLNYSWKTYKVLL